MSSKREGCAAGTQGIFAAQHLVELALKREESDNRRILGFSVDMFTIGCEAAIEPELMRFGPCLNGCLNPRNFPLK